MKTPFETTSLPRDVSPVAGPKADSLLAAQLKAFLAAHQLTQALVARKTGVDASALNAWLNGKPKGAFRALEAAVADFLHTEPLRVKLALKKFDTPCHQTLRKVFLDTKETTTIHNVSIVVGPAGIGKTCAIEMLQVEFPSAVLMTAHKLAGGAAAQFNKLWCSVSDRGFGKWRREHPAGSRLDFMVERFLGSDRVFLIDSCHRLTVGGIEFWFDFAEATQCPMILTGNKDFLRRLHAVPDHDQVLSRVGRYYELSMESGRALAAGLLQQLLPRHKSELLGPAERVAAQHGHGRRLLKTIDLTRRELLGGATDAVQAFQDAQTMLLGG